MGWRYDNLWNILKQRNITNDELRFKIRCSPATLIKMANNGNVSLDVIERICEDLNCLPSDIMEYEPRERPLHIEIVRKKGDIFIIDFPRPYRDRDGENDDEENVRLGLIFQNDDYLEQAHSIMTIPLSSQISLNSKIANVVIQPDELNKLQYPFALQIADMHMLRRMHLKQQYGRISDKDIQAVNKAVKDFFSL